MHISRCLALLICLGSAPAWAQGDRPPSWYQPFGPGGWASSWFGGQNAAVLDVVMNQCGTTPVVKKGGPLTVGRAATQNYVCADGVMRSAPANTIPITEQGGQIFGAGTNTILQSEDFATTWTTSGVGVAAPTITTNQRNSPQGTLTADQVDFPAVSGANVSIVQQSFTATAVPWTGSVYVVGNSPGTIYLSFGTTISAPCVYTSTRYTRCSVTGTLTAAAWSFKIGVDKTTTGNADQGAQTVFLSDAQVESVSSASPSPYQPTTTTTVSWPATNISTALPGFVANNPACVNIVGIFNSTTYGTGRIWAFNDAANTGTFLATSSQIGYYDGSTRALVNASWAPTPINLSTCWNATNVTNLVRGTGVSATAARGVTGASTGVFIGTDSIYYLNGYVSRFQICNSSNPAQCKP